MERMLKVRERVVGGTDAAVSGVTSGERECGLESKTDLLKVPSGGVFSGRHGSGADGRAQLVDCVCCCS